jgi:hypothetical protein
MTSIFRIQTVLESLTARGIGSGDVVLPFCVMETMYEAVEIGHTGRLYVSRKSLDLIGRKSSQFGSSGACGKCAGCPEGIFILYWQIAVRFW